jgi:rubrerythrin
MNDTTNEERQRHDDILEAAERIYCNGGVNGPGYPGFISRLDAIELARKRHDEFTLEMKEFMAMVDRVAREKKEQDALLWKGRRAKEEDAPHRCSQCGTAVYNCDLFKGPVCPRCGHWV